MRGRRAGVVVATTVGGAALLGRSLAEEPGSRSFYLSTAAVAATWVAGGMASGPLRSRRSDPAYGERHPFAGPVAAGAGAFGVFYLGAHVARRIPPLGDAVAGVLRFAEEGDDRLVMATTLVNGLAEEVFFRGAVYAALDGHHPVLGSTATYALVTTTTRNPALVLAAAAMGTLFAVQRRRSGGIRAPILTHLTWSALVLRWLPPLFRRPSSRPST